MYNFSVLLHTHMTQNNAPRTHQLLQVTLH